MISPEPYDQRIASRLDEFWASSTRWHRSLWNLGAAAAIGELLETSESLPSPALSALQAEVAQLAGPDPAVGDDAVRRALVKLLRVNLVFRHAEWHKLFQLLNLIETEYLKRWADLLRGTDCLGTERVARSVAGHLLHAGFSATYLSRWLRWQVNHRPSMLTIADLVEEANGLVGRPKRQFKVVVPVISAPRVKTKPPPEWLPGKKIAEMVADIQGKRTDLRQNGGFVLTVTARDRYGAVEMVSDLMDRWDARAELSTGNRIVRANKAWVEGFDSPIPLTTLGRRIDIGALDRQDKIYASLSLDQTSVRIDDALQLAQPMEAGPRAAAISGGWASIESLLTESQEAESLASPRLASIIACSFPRAELTTLAFAHRDTATDPLAVALNEADGNLGRARIMADALSANAPGVGRGWHDDAAYERMRALLSDPKRTLRRVREYVTSCLNRLYRQRNLTLHGGRVTGDGRSQALSTAPRLIGAGLDRIAHAWFAEGTPPIVLAARAELGLELVGSPAGRHPTELLEPTEPL